jgi:hypothetical protein
MYRLLPCSVAVSIIFRLVAAFVIIFIVLFASRGRVNASTTWHYSGSTYSSFQNDAGELVPAGQKVLIDITFDPLTPDSVPYSVVGDYLMSGGDTRFQMSIGGHISTPVTSYRIIVVTDDSSSTNDQYNFLSYASQGSYMDIDFPGFLEENVVANLAFFRRAIPGPITSEALPIEQPNPAAFEQVRVAVQRRVSTPYIVGIGTRLDAIPEPSTLLLLGIAAISLLGCRRSKSHG